MARWPAGEHINHYPTAVPRYMVLAPPFYRLVSTQWVMFLIQHQLPLLPRTFYSTHLGKVDLGDKINYIFFKPVLERDSNMTSRLPGRSANNGAAKTTSFIFSVFP